MSGKRKGPGGGNPRNRKQATERRNPCPRCATGERRRSSAGLSAWCLDCSDRARKRGARNRPTAAMIRASIIGTGRDLGICDAEGNLLESA